MRRPSIISEYLSNVTVCGRPRSCPSRTVAAEIAAALSGGSAGGVQPAPGAASAASAASAAGTSAGDDTDRALRMRPPSACARDRFDREGNRAALQAPRGGFAASYGRFAISWTSLVKYGGIPPHRL